MLSSPGVGVGEVHAGGFCIPAPTIGEWGRMESVPHKTYVTEPATDQVLELGLSSCPELKSKCAVGSEKGSHVDKLPGE